MDGSVARRVRRRATVATAASSRPSTSRTRRSSSSMRAGSTAHRWKGWNFWSLKSRQIAWASSSCQASSLRTSRVAQGLQHSFIASTPALPETCWNGSR